MEQRSNNAALKGAQIMLRTEECALSMEQYRQGNDAALKGARIKFEKEECT